MSAIEDFGGIAGRDGVCAGLYFGLSASFAKPVVNDLRAKRSATGRRAGRQGEVLGRWETCSGSPMRCQPATTAHWVGHVLVPRTFTARETTSRTTA